MTHFFKKTLLIASFLTPFSIWAQANSWLDASKSKSASIEVYYYNNFPFAYSNSGSQPQGIEVDVLNAFSDWLKEKKGVDLALKYVAFDDFEKFYRSVQKFDNGVIGLGSVSINAARKNEVKFTAPFLKNQMLFVSNLELPSVMNFNNLSKNLENKTALVMSGTSHEAHLLEIKNKYFPKMRVEFVSSQKELLDKVTADPNYFGYVDLLSYWDYFRNNPTASLKIHRGISQGEDYLGLIMPINADWHMPFAEFFESGFGFTSTVEYRKILEKYLGYEVIESVELY